MARRGRGIARVIPWRRFPWHRFRRHWFHWHWFFWHWFRRHWLLWHGPPRGSFLDWRERRSALGDLKQRQADEEQRLMGQNLNPINLAKLALTSGDAVAAASQWERARRQVPNAVLVSEEPLEILLGLERYDEAEALMRERMKRSAGDRFALAGLARIAEQRGDFAEALKRWKLVRRRVQDTAEGFLGCARCLFEQGSLDAAEAQYDAAIRRVPDELRAWIGRARISDRRKDWPESLARWKYMAETFRYAPAYAFAAKVMNELGRIDDAEAWLAVPAMLFTNDLEIAVTRSHLAQHRGDLTAACDRWATVRRIAPYFSSGYHEGAHRLCEAGRHAEADGVLLAAIERFPDQAWPMLSYARHAHEQHDWDEAATRWAALRQRFPAEESGFSLGVEALNAAGRTGEAVALRRGA